jgi:DNA-binding NarL/FixJ family response regulator
MRQAEKVKINTGQSDATAVLLACARSDCYSKMLSATQDPRQHCNVIMHFETMQEAYINPVPKGAQVALVSADFGNEKWEVLELIRRIRGQAPDTKIILFANTRKRETVIAAFKCGARGVLNLGDFELRELGSCLETVRAGKVWADSTEAGWITEALMESDWREAAGPDQVRVSDFSILCTRTVLMSDLLEKPRTSRKDEKSSSNDV